MVSRATGAIAFTSAFLPHRAGGAVAIRALSVVLLLSAGAFYGCTPSWYRESADREVGGILHDYSERVLANRSSRVKMPEKMVESEETEMDAAADVSADSSDADDSAQEVIVLALESALAQAFESSPDLKTQRESLYRSGLSYSLTRYNFGPILNSSVSYIWNDVEGGEPTGSTSANAGVSSIIPTGGNVSLSTALSNTHDAGSFPLSVEGENEYTSSLQVSLRQPLLRGAGHDIAYESLTQGERNLVYAVRSFELFREDLAIRVANDFFGLVRRQQQLANDLVNYENAVWDRNKAEALRQVDRNQEDDVFQARRREIEAENSLLVSQTNLRLAMDDFKILLGLPTSAEIEITNEPPPFLPVRMQEQSAVEAALFNRLDLHTSRDRVEDAERQLEIAKNALLPDFDLGLTHGYRGASTDFERSLPDEHSTSAELTFEIPLDRKSERNQYRSALISVEQSRRDLRQFEDEVERDILNQLRELTQIEKRIGLQEDQIKQEERAVAVNQILVESGDAQTRDLLDARQALNNARNTLIDLQVQHFISRLRLARNIGIFFVDDKGMWQE